jgi:hypothetical protein
MSVLRVPLAGLLTWVVPGLGHLFLGQKTRGLVCMAAITATFWSGVAIGSVQGTVAPHSRRLWFVAQLGSGGNALAAYGLHKLVDPQSAASPTPKVAGHWASAEVGVHYTGVAGLLNLLVILDAMVRAETGGSRDRRRPGTPDGVT